MHLVCASSCAGLILARRFVMVGDSELRFREFRRLPHKGLRSGGFYVAALSRPWSLLLRPPWEVTLDLGLPSFYPFALCPGEVLRWLSFSSFPNAEMLGVANVHPYPESLSLCLPFSVSFLLTNGDSCGRLYVAEHWVWLIHKGWKFGLSQRSGFLIILSKMGKPLRTQLQLDSGS